MLPLHDDIMDRADKIDTVRMILAYLAESFCWYQEKRGGLSDDAATGLASLLMGCDKLLESARQ